MLLTTIRSFIDQIQKLDKSSEYEYFYRGHSKKDYILKPSIYRSESLIESEDIMYKELLRHRFDSFLDCRSTFDHLVKMQHYSLPTRLLDVTTNPLIALYFACCSNYKRIGEVVIFKVPKAEILYSDSDTVSILSNIAIQDKNFVYDSTLCREKFNNKPNISKLLHSIKHEKSFFKEIIEPNALNQVVCVKSIMNNKRIINQSGAFFLFGAESEKIKYSQIKEDWILLQEDKRLFVKSSNKKTILKSLDLLGVNESIVYPEMEKYAEWLNKKYINKKNS